MLREHEAIVGWHTMDEPRAHDPEMGELRYMIQMYQTVKQCDPLRPVSYNLGTTGLHSKHAPVSASDAVMYDYYTYPVGPDRRPMEKAQEHLRFACRWAVETGRPLYTYIGLNVGAYPNHIRLYRPVELRCRMYLDLVEGSRGLFFYSGPPASKTLWDAFGECAKQITALAPAWFNPNNAVSVEADFVRMRCYVGDLGDKLVLVAVNPTRQAPRVTLSLRASYRLPDGAEVMFEDRTLAINKAQIVDRFGAYGVHVYSIAK